MTSPIANPTPVTPPRVPFFDERTGLISREWYMFFISLYTNTADLNSQELTPALTDQSGTYSALLQTAQLSAQVAELQAQVQAVQAEMGVVSDIAALQTAVQGLALAPPPREFKRARYGQFYDTTTQVAAAINTPYAITFNNTDVSKGVFLGTPSSRVTVDTEGVYNFLFSIQLDKTAGGTGIFWTWPRINGVDVPNSNSQVQIQGNNAEQLVTVGYFFELNAGDYVEVMFAVNDTTVQVDTFPATAFYPAIPSIILTVSNNIEGVQ